jgi:hypothetical protein
MLLDFYSLDCYFSKLGRESRELSFVPFCTVNRPEFGWLSLAGQPGRGLRGGLFSGPAAWSVPPTPADLILLTQPVYYPKIKRRWVQPLPVPLAFCSGTLAALCSAHSLWGWVLVYVPRKGGFLQHLDGPDGCASVLRLQGA